MQSQGPNSDEIPHVTVTEVVDIESFAAIPETAPKLELQTFHVETPHVHCAGEGINPKSASMIHCAPERRIHLYDDLKPVDTSMKNMNTATGFVETAANESSPVITLRHGLQPPTENSPFVDTSLYVTVL